MSRGSSGAGGFETLPLLLVCDVSMGGSTGVSVGVSGMASCEGTPCSASFSSIIKHINNKEFIYIAHNYSEVSKRFW